MIFFRARLVPTNCNYPWGDRQQQRARSNQIEKLGTEINQHTRLSSEEFNFADINNNNLKLVFVLIAKRRNLKFYLFN